MAKDIESNEEINYGGLAMKLIDADAFDALLVDAQRRAKNNFQYGFLSSVRANLADMPEAEAYTEARQRIENMEKIIEDQQERIDIMAADIDWISVESGNEPPYDKDFLLYLKSGEYFVGHRESHWGQDVYCDGKLGGGYVYPTHWMRLPKPPKEGASNG